MKDLFFLYLFFKENTFISTCDHKNDRVLTFTIDMTFFYSTVDMALFTRLENHSNWNYVRGLISSYQSLDNTIPK